VSEGASSIVWAAMIPDGGPSLTAQLRIISLFDGSIKRVHVDVDDLTHAHLHSMPVFQNASESV
jgi:hypothetical protein